MANYLRNFAPDQRFHLGEAGQPVTEVRGVQSVTLNGALPAQPLSFLGKSYGGTVTAGEITNSITVNRLMVIEEDMTTGWLDTMIDGVLAYGPQKKFNKSALFSSGYITSYRSACSVGDVPSADLEIAVYGGLGEGTTGLLGTNVDPTKIPVPGTISLDVSGYNTNAVQSYNFEVALRRQPTYIIGNSFLPTYFPLERPIEVTLQFDMVVEDYEAPNIRNMLCNTPQQTLNIILNDCSGNKIRQFAVPSGRFTDFNQEATVDNNMAISTTYKAYFPDITGVSQIFS